MTLVLFLALTAAPVQDPAPAPRDTLPPHRLPEVSVIGAPNRLKLIPGSGTVLDARSIVQVQSRSLNEVLHRVPGIHVRDEEGIGLRPNIGLRGLNPTRSTTVLLLEDGVPISLAPYGDNGSYYVPPIDRFEGVEVLKGSGQIAFGPRTIGGVINLLTLAPPATGQTGRLRVAGGNREHRMVHARYGLGADGTGVLVDLLHKRAAAGRANLGTTINDGTVKAELALPGAQSLGLKANYYRERSQVTYSGLREEEWAIDPYANPFVNDSMFMDRMALSAVHRAGVSGQVALHTRLYANFLSRDWWRQSSNSTERPNDAGDPACSGLADLSTSCGNQGRLRSYRVVGMEPRVLVDLAGLGAGSRLDAGLRLHLERQERRQENGSGPDARVAGPATDPNAGIVEDNIRTNTALAAFLQPTIQMGNWAIAPGLRLEHVDYERANRLPSTGDSDGISGRTSLTQLIPGVGITWNPSTSTTLFSGIHRGFAPPRTEDIITNQGGLVDLDAELSWNSELGVRLAPRPGLQAELTLFQLDFSNQIIPASVAGGSGATLTSAGETLHRGLELGARFGSEWLVTSPHRVSLELAWTWLPVARFEGERYAWIGTEDSDVPGKVYQSQNAAETRQQVSVTGNRLPYAPEHLLTAAVGFEHGSGPALRLEAVVQGSQHSDPANTNQTVPDGQQGPITSATIWNVNAGWRLQRLRSTLTFAVKNLFDRLHVVDRSRGLMPGAPRLIQGGLVVDF